LRFKPPIPSILASAAHRATCRDHYIRDSLRPLPSRCLGECIARSRLGDLRCHFDSGGFRFERRHAAALLLTALPADGATSLARVSSASHSPMPIQPLPQEVNYVNAEVEPWVAVNPRNPAKHYRRLATGIAFQFGGSRGLMTGRVAQRRGKLERMFAHFSPRAGGNARNNGNYERASDPWVTISPNGVAHQIALSFNSSTT